VVQHSSDLIEDGYRFLSATGEVMVRPHDIDRRTWERAKREARAIMIATARSAKGTITYNELASRITGLRLEPGSLALRELLGEISLAEDMAGRGMLSVVVVHQGEDCLPGHGFFTLARGFGRDTSKKEKLWAAEFARVREVWRTSQCEN
jgi:hypothetical protein